MKRLKTSSGLAHGRSMAEIQRLLVDAFYVIMY